MIVKICTNSIAPMKKIICSILCLLLGAAGLASAQSPDAVPAHGTIEIQVRGIPNDDATAISGQYLLDGNGTIRMPQLPAGQDVLRVVGKTARQTPALKHFSRPGFPQGSRVFYCPGSGRSC